MTPTATRPVVTAWSTVSPYGLGREDFVAGVRAGRPTAAPPDPQRWDVPTPLANLVPGFEPADVLGRKGTRSMDRATGLAVTAVGQLLRSAPAGRADGDAALVLGTTGGSVQSMMDFTRRGLTADRPYLVDPARFPNAVMNRAAAASAIWHELRGPNATVAGGRASGLFALQYARRLLAAGRARTVLCGAVEEFSPARCWLDRHARDAATAEPPGEGCALLRLEPPGADAEVLAELLAVELGLAGPDGPADVLARCVRRALAAAGTDPAQVRVAVPGGAPGAAGAAERRVLAEAVPAAQVLELPALIGDTAGAAVSFGIAACLALAGRDADPGSVVLVSATDGDGQTGCALLRLR